MNKRRLRVRNDHGSSHRLGQVARSVSNLIMDNIIAKFLDIHRSLYLNKRSDIAIHNIIRLITWVDVAHTGFMRHDRFSGQHNNRPGGVLHDDFADLLRGYIPGIIRNIENNLIPPWLKNIHRPDRYNFFGDDSVKRILCTCSRIAKCLPCFN